MSTLRHLHSASLRNIIVLSLVAASFMAECLAASRFWDGSSDGNLATAANWVGGVAPVAGDDLVFQTGVTRLLVTNNFSPNRAFNSILFQGSNYFLRGNSILITNGINSINPVGANRVDADVDVRASQTWEAQGSLASLDINGDINLNTNTLTVRANTGDFFFSGTISGTGNIVKTHAGTLRMDGSGGHNTYSGFTRVDGGVLELIKFDIVPSFTNYTSIPGDLIVGDAAGGIGVDVVRLFSANQIADTSDVTVRSSGFLDLNGVNDRIGSLTMQGGTVDSGAGALTLNGGVTTLADANQATINGELTLTVGSGDFNIASGAASPDLRINATVSSSTTLFTSAGIGKSGFGTLTLAGTNTYNGLTTINEGTIIALTDRALGATEHPISSAGTIINSNGFLWLQNVQITNEFLTMNNASSVTLQTQGASVWTGDILLNGDVFFAVVDSLLLNGQITGAGGFTMVGFPGTITLSGTNGNTYTGTTWVRDGTLILYKLLPVSAVRGPLVIGEDELPEGADIVRYQNAAQLPDDIDVTINASGLLDLNGFSDSVDNITLNGGDIDAPSPGNILPLGNITVNRNTNSQAIISGRMSLQSNPIIDVTGHFFSPDLSILAQLIGAGSLTKNGLGEVGLNSSNSYTGLTVVNDGFLLVRDSHALGATNSGTTVRTGAVLSLNGGVHVPREALSLAGTGQGSFGALTATFGSNSWAGDITLTSNAIIYVDAGDFLNLSGAIGGAFDLTKTGTGTLIYSGGTANTYDGTFVNAGTLELSKTIVNAAIPGDLRIGDGIGGASSDVTRINSTIGQIGNAGIINILGSGLLDINTSVFEIVNGVQASGRIDLGVGTLEVDIEDDFTYSGSISGAGILRKNGNGNWTLTGNNTYTGDTIVAGDGALIVNGSQPQSDVFLLDDANLGGSGVVGSIDSDGAVGPGPYLPGPAILTCSNVFLGPQEFLNIDIVGALPGTGHDQLNVRGTNRITDANLSVRVASGFAPTEGQQFTILNNDGAEAIVGTFLGKPNNSIFTADGLKFHIRYSEVFGNDIVLMVTNIATHFVSATVSGGNGNGAVDLNECNLLNVVITNTAGNVLSNVVARLVPKTPGVSVTQSRSAYPTMAINARGTNVTPFQFSTGPGFLCGTNLEFDLVVQTLTNGLFTIPITLPSGSAAAAFRFNNNTVTAIPDAGSVDSLISVSGITTPIKRVTVSLHITHTTDSDLDISLIAPDGTIINLSSDNGGTSSDYGTDCAADASRTTFNDAAATPITSGTAPFVGSFRPEQPLSVLNEKFGADVNGTWRLRIADDAAGGIGSLRCWSLFISPTACADGGGGCESCPEARVISGLLTTNSFMQTNRLTRNGEESVCGPQKICPGPTGALGDRPYNTHVFENGESNACISVTFVSGCGNSLFTAAYTNFYNPFDICQNYLADAGSSAPTNVYSFSVGPRARFVVVVHAVDPGLTCSYTLSVNGGSCRPVLRIQPITSNRVVLDWSSAAIGYNLLQTNRLPSVPNPNWIPVTPAPVLFNGRYRVTNTMNPSNAFYELRKP